MEIVCNTCGKRIRHSALFIRVNGKVTAHCYSYPKACYLNETHTLFSRFEVLELKLIEFKEYEPKRESIGLALRYKVLKRDRFKCVACGSDDKLEIDHIKPVAAGGKTEYRNLQTLCFRCNRGKGANL